MKIVRAGLNGPGMDWADMLKLVPLPGRSPDYQACLSAFPALELAKITPQGAFHREGDVWTHTKMVVESLLALPGYQGASQGEREIVFLSALLHDMAKHSTTVIDPETGDIRQPGHSRRGSIDARVALWDAGAPFKAREHICRLVSAHQTPFFACKPGPGKLEPEFVARRLSWQLSVKLLALLAESDLRGRICDDQEKVLGYIEMFRETARADGCFDQAKSFASRHTALKYFRGLHVDPSFDLYQEPGSLVTMMAGLPASGKNTWVEANRKGLPVVSFDDAREELGLRHGKNEGMVAHAATDKAKDLLRSKTPFVWNATHLTSQTRQKTLDLLLAYNAEVELVYVEAPRRVIMSRNTKRDTSLSNKSIEEMLFKWEVPLPMEAHRVLYPSEGFDPKNKERKRIVSIG